MHGYDIYVREMMKNQTSIFRHILNIKYQKFNTIQTSSIFQLTWQRMQTNNLPLINSVLNLIKERKLTVSCIYQSWMSC